MPKNLHIFDIFFKRDCYYKRLAFPMRRCPQTSTAKPFFRSVKLWFCGEKLKLLVEGIISVISKISESLNLFGIG
jgi:hypothetical protein